MRNAWISFETAAIARTSSLSSTINVALHSGERHLAEPTLVSLDGEDMLPRGVSLTLAAFTALRATGTT